MRRSTASQAVFFPPSGAEALPSMWSSTLGSGGAALARAGSFRWVAWRVDSKNSSRILERPRATFRRTLAPDLGASLGRPSDQPRRAHESSPTRAHRRTLAVRDIRPQSCRRTHMCFTLCVVEGVRVALQSQHAHVTRRISGCWLARGETSALRSPALCGSAVQPFLSHVDRSDPRLVVPRPASRVVAGRGHADART